MKPLLAAGLDVGSATTCAVIVEMAPGSDEVAVLGVGETGTDGVRGDSVTDIRAMTDSIRFAMAEAELMAGRQAGSVYAGIGGGHIETEISLGVSRIFDSEVSAGDLARCREVAEAVVLPVDREMLHVIPQDYRVDGRGGMAGPIGMTGTRLECDAFVVTSSSQAADNLRRAVARAGYVIDGLVLEPLAASRAVLAEEEKEVGVALADMGASSTSIAAYREGRLEHVSILPFGGDALTADLANGLSVSYAEARRAKESYATAMASMVDPHETVDMPGPSPGQMRPVARELISHIVEQRLAEMLSLVERDLEGTVALETLSAGLVLCGGTAGIPGALEIAERTLASPVRVGTPGGGASSFASGIDLPRYATAAGLALWSGDLAREQGAASSRGAALAARVIVWLKDFF